MEVGGELDPCQENPSNTTPPFPHTECVGSVTASFGVTILMEKGGYSEHLPTQFLTQAVDLTSPRCKLAYDPRNALPGRESSPTVCIDRLYGAAFSLQESESELCRQGR